MNICFLPVDIKIYMVINIIGSLILFWWKVQECWNTFPEISTVLTYLWRETQNTRELLYFRYLRFIEYCFLFCFRFICIDWIFLLYTITDRNIAFLVHFSYALHVELWESSCKSVHFLLTNISKEAIVG